MALISWFLRLWEKALVGSMLPRTVGVPSHWNECNVILLDGRDAKQMRSNYATTIPPASVIPISMPDRQRIRRCLFLLQHIIETVVSERRLSRGICYTLFWAVYTVHFPQVIIFCCLWLKWNCNVYIPSSNEDYWPSTQLEAVHYSNWLLISRNVLFLASGRIHNFFFILLLSAGLVWN